MKFVSERQRRARRLRIARGALVALALTGMAVAVGLLLPTAHTTTGTAMFDRPPDAVWRVLTDLDGMPLWRSDLTTLERLPNHGGKTVWREIGRAGAQVLEFWWEDPPRRLVMQSAEAGQVNYPIRTFELSSIGGGTRVTMTARAVVSNPLVRVLVRLDPSRPAVERFLHDLDQRLNLNRRQVATDAIR
jgi:uncharacterized protein YndB with AHSA1/START domain